MSSFRRWFPLETEYRVRRALNAGSAVEGQPTIVHVAGWKTASQWVRMVFSDPQLMRATGYRAAYVRGSAGASGLHGSMLTESTLLTPTYIDAGTDLIDDHHRVFAVVREPVDLARSWLRTNVANHPSNDDVDARRTGLMALIDDGATPLEVFRASLDDGFRESLLIAASWIERSTIDDHVLVTRFEDLTHPTRSQSELVRIFDHVGFGDHADLADTLVRRYHKAQIARVERVIRPASERKYGDGPAADADLQAALSDADVATALRSFAPDLIEPLVRFYAPTGAAPALVQPGARR